MTTDQGEMEPLDVGMPYHRYGTEAILANHFCQKRGQFVATLQPPWTTFPSPEARAARVSNATRPFRAGNGWTSHTPMDWGSR
jgi:hypothetical protein